MAHVHQTVAAIIDQQRCIDLRLKFIDGPA